MKRLLLPLLAALAVPTSVNADSVWLIIRNGYGLGKIEMKDMDQCKSQGRDYYVSHGYGLNLHAY